MDYSTGHANDESINEAPTADAGAGNAPAKPKKRPRNKKVAKPGRSTVVYEYRAFGPIDQEHKKLLARWFYEQTRYWNSKVANERCVPRPEFPNDQPGRLTQIEALFLTDPNYAKLCADLQTAQDRLDALTKQQRKANSDSGVKRGKKADQVGDFDAARKARQEAKAAKNAYRSALFKGHEFRDRIKAIDAATKRRGELLHKDFDLPTAFVNTIRLAFSETCRKLLSEKKGRRPNFHSYDGGGSVSVCTKKGGVWSLESLETGVDGDGARLRVVWSPTAASGHSAIFASGDHFFVKPTRSPTRLIRPGSTWSPNFNKKVGNAVLHVEIDTGWRGRKKVKEPLTMTIPFTIGAGRLILDANGKKQYDQYGRVLRERHEIPSDAEIKKVRLVQRRTGVGKTAYYVQFSCDVYKRPPKGEGAVALDVGWRRTDDGGMLVCTWSDTFGETGELKLKPELIANLRGEDAKKAKSNKNQVTALDDESDTEEDEEEEEDVDIDGWDSEPIDETGHDYRSVQRRRDLAFNEMRDQLASWINSRTDLPEWLTKRTKSLRQWRSAAKLAKLTLDWRDNRYDASRFDGDDAILSALEK